LLVTRVRRCLLLAMTVVATTTAARGQWMITPQLAANVAGDVEFRRGGPGASVAHLGSRFGLELELQRYQHFFKDSGIHPLAASAPPNCTGTVTPCRDINTDAIGVMGNVVVPFRSRGATWRPYATAGLGLIHAWTNEPGRHQSDFGLNLGAGTMYSLGKRVGLRGDLRWSRAFADAHESAGVSLKDYGFWRVSLGVTLGSSR
jgi:hypothetical protein